MSSFRRSHHPSSPPYDYELRFENRNSEDVHREALAAAYTEHQRIQEAAVRATRLEEARLEQLRLQQQTIQEEERVRLEEERVREQIRLREIENRAKQIPKVPARIPTPPPSAQTPAQETKPSAPASSQLAPAAAVPSTHQSTTPVAQPPIAQPFNQVQTTQPPTTQPSNSFTQPVSQPSNPFVQQPAVVPSTISQPATQLPMKTTPPQPSTTQMHPYLLAGVDRYVEIHKSLKELRKYVNNAGNTDKPFKKQVGDLRRTLRMAVGQCVKDKSKNKDPVSTRILNLCMHSLTIKFRSTRSSAYSSKPSLRFQAPVSIRACSCYPSRNLAKEPPTMANNSPRCSYFF